jgi:hypothetical protein
MPRDQPLQATIAQFIKNKKSRPASAARAFKGPPKKPPPPTPESPVVQDSLSSVPPPRDLEMTIDWSFAEMEDSGDLIPQWGI